MKTSTIVKWLVGTGVVLGAILLFVPVISHEVDDESVMTVVLAVPSVNDEYYEEVFDQILDFHIRYANTIYGNDDVLVLADRDTMPLLTGRVPEEILVETEVADIWIRDFSTVNPYNPVQFRYDGEYFEDPRVPREIQASFNDFARSENILYERSPYILDGGNVVDNYKGSIVVSERFLEDNNLSRRRARTVLQREYGAEYVAIIPYDDEIMGHADGMVMFVDDVLFVNKYEEPFRNEVLERLHEGLPETIEIVEVDTDFEIEQWKDFSSACGIHLNSLVTENNIYVPIFGDHKKDQQFIDVLRKNTNKKIHTIDAQNVCFMGGSVRCLSWQVVL
jgi:agmatine/peptidylarginine deiminase